MSIPTYDRDKYYRIMDRAQLNYANQLKRLSRNEKRSNFILIYYSLLLIVSSLSVKYYPNLFDTSWISYSSIILSTIVLIYSIVNSKADYSNRISKIQIALNEVKRLKREMGALPLIPSTEEQVEKTNMGKKRGKAFEYLPIVIRSTASNDNMKELHEKYHRIKLEYDEVVSSNEVRDDLDFFRTIRQLCKQYGLNHITGKEKKGNEKNTDNSVAIEEIRGYIAEINPVFQWIYIIAQTILHAFLYLAPIIILGLGIVIKFS